MKKKFVVIEFIKKIKNKLNTKNPVILKILFVILCLILSIPAVLIGKSGFFRSVDYAVEDALYQRNNEESDNIVIIGIHNDDVDKYGSFSDDKSLFYNLIYKLYLEDVYSPAVTGINYSLITTDYSEYSEKLAAICYNKNIVISNKLNLESSVSILDDAKLSRNINVKSVLNPYESLKEKVEVGYTNVIYDHDGIVRHYPWKIENGESYDSFAKKCFDLYNSKLKRTIEVETTNEDIFGIHFSGAPMHYLEYSYDDIMTNNYDKSNLAGKIVLIGFYDYALADGYFTAADRSNVMFNVEVQANAIECALNETTIIDVPLKYQLLVLYITCIITIMIALTCNLLPTTIFSVSISATNILISNILWSNGRAVHLLYILINTAFIYVIYILICLQKERSGNFTMRNKFDEVLDKNITSKILKETDIVSTKKNICVMFADLRNFTAVSSMMNTDDLVNMLNEYFDAAAQCIKDNEGTIDKYNGDDIMALWGAPNEVEDCVYKACKAALDITHKIEEINKTIYSKYDRSLTFGIGINYGEAVIGYIGSEGHKEYTAIGDVVNIASRIEAKAPRGCVYITKVVKDMLGDRARVSSFDHKFVIKGKVQPIDLYLLEAIDLRPGYYKEQEI